MLPKSTVFKCYCCNASVLQGLGGSDRSILMQIEQIMMDKERLLRRTQTKRSLYRILGKSELDSSLPAHIPDEALVIRWSLVSCFNLCLQTFFVLIINFCCPLEVALCVLKDFVNKISWNMQPHLDWHKFCSEEELQIHLVFKLY